MIVACLVNQESKAASSARTTTAHFSVPRDNSEIIWEIGKTQVPYSLMMPFCKTNPICLSCSFVLDFGIVGRGVQRLQSPLLGFAECLQGFVELPIKGGLVAREQLGGAVG